MKLKFVHIIRKSKVDCFLIGILALIIIFTRIFFMENYLEQLIHIDSYKYIYSAIFLDSSGTFQGSFVRFISLIYPSNMEPSNAIIFMRLIMIVFSIQLVMFIYLIAKNFFSSSFSFIVALFVSFLPINLLYSTTLHNDIFALAMSFTSLYITIRFKNLIGLVFATIFILIASTARIESIIFIIPIFISFSLYLRKKIGIKFRIIFTSLLTAFFGVGIFAGQEIGKSFYYHNQFDRPIDQVIFYLTPKNIMLTFNSIFNISENMSINNLFSIMASVGLISIIILNRKEISGIFNKNIEFSDKTFTSIYLMIIFSLSFLFLVSFHIGWTYDDDGNLIAKEHILPRYLLNSTILVTIPFVYLIMIFTCQSSKSLNSIFRKIRSVS